MLEELKVQIVQYEVGSQLVLDALGDYKAKDIDAR